MDVIFSRSHNIRHYAVALWQRCKWAHVGIIDGDHVIEASGKQRKVVRTKLSDFKKRSIETLTKNIPGDIKKARALVGRPYDISAIHGMILGFNLERPFAFHCSELVAYELGINRPGECWKCTPKDILKHIEKINKKNS